MSIISAIKKNKFEVFRRIYAKRRLKTGEYESTWQLVPEKYIISYGTIQNSVDDILPNHVKYSGFTLKVSNNEGFFSDETRSKSFFYDHLTRYRTLIKVEAGYIYEGAELPTETTLFLGILSDDFIYSEDTKMIFKIDHISKIFNEVMADEISDLDSGQTASDIITKIKNHQDDNGVSIFQKYITSGAWHIDATTINYNIQTSSTLRNVSCWKLMQNLSEAESYIMYIAANGDFYFKDSTDISTTADYHFSGLNDPNKSYGHNIIEISVNDENLRKV